MVIVMPEILLPEELVSMHQRLAAAPWDSGVSAGPQARLVKHNRQIAETEMSAGLLRDLRGTVMRALNRSPELVSAVLPNKVIPPNFNRYDPDFPAYGPHIDNTLRPLPDGSWLRTDVSATVFLSDPDEYDGGELVVHDSFGVHRVKAPAGAIVVYPSGSLHEVRPVTRGTRFAAYLFMQSLVRDASHRRMLWEIDQALRRLRSELGDGHPELVQLTGTYHNLLREWSET
ncbi:MAG: Fe2+-dependent dioxygenase [Thioalkalivibrionaceae bacterium]